LLYVDSNNNVILKKTTVDNEVAASLAIGGDPKGVASTSLAGTTDFFLITITWSTAADKIRVFLNGAQAGGDLSGLGTWEGNFLAIGTVIGAGNTTPANVWRGLICHPVLFRDVLTDAEILKIAKLGDVT